MNNDLSAKVDYIWNELNALKSSQNLSSRGLRVGGRKKLDVNETMNYVYPSGWDDRDWNFILDITLTNTTTNVPPISNVDCRIYPNSGQYVSDTSLICVGATANRVTWRFQARYRFESSTTVTVSGYIVSNSLVDATFSYRRVK